MTVDVALVLQTIPQVLLERVSDPRVRLTEVVGAAGHQHEIREDRLEVGTRQRTDEPRRHLVEMCDQHGIVDVTQRHAVQASLLVDELGLERVGRTGRPIEVLDRSALMDEPEDLTRVLASGPCRSVVAVDLSRLGEEGDRSGGEHDGREQAEPVETHDA